VHLLVVWYLVNLPQWLYLLTQPSAKQWNTHKVNQSTDHSVSQKPQVICYNLFNKTDNNSPNPKVLWFSGTQELNTMQIKTSKSKKWLYIKLYPDFITNVQYEPMSHVTLWVTSSDAIILGGGGAGCNLLKVIAWKTISQQTTSINIYGRFNLLSTLKEHHVRQFYDKWTTYLTSSDNIIAAWRKRRRKRKDKLREMIITKHRKRGYKGRDKNGIKRR
jgi:hypothetical protein